MQIVTEDQRMFHSNGSMSGAYEYPMDEPDINIAEVGVRGRYPDNGIVYNQICKELVYVRTASSGSQLVVDGRSTPVRAKSVILIEPGERYFWEGHLDLVISATQAWKPDQHHHESHA